MGECSSRLPSSSVKITLKINGKASTYEVGVNTYVGELRKAISDDFDVDYAKIHFFCNGALIGDDQTFGFLASQGCSYFELRDTKNQLMAEALLPVDMGSVPMATGALLASPAKTAPSPSRPPALPKKKKAAPALPKKKNGVKAKRSVGKPKAVKKAKPKGASGSDVVDINAHIADELPQTAETRESLQRLQRLVEGPGKSGVSPKKKAGGKAGTSLAKRGSNLKPISTASGGQAMPLSTGSPQNIRQVAQTPGKAEGARA